MKKLASTLALSALALATSAQAAPATYGIDPTHTFASFEQLHFGTSTVRGRFDKKDGSITIDRAARTGKAEIVFDLNGINTGVEPFNAHLKSADFFDVANHPKATFVGTQFSFEGDKVSVVAGALTMRGKTHPVTLKAVRFNCYENTMIKREVCGGDFETTIKRSLWGVNFGLDFGFADDTKVTIQVEAIQQ